MGILYWNILGIVLVISLIIFIAKFYKNHHVVDKTEFGEVKMNVKITKNDVNDVNFSNNQSQNNYKKNNNSRGNDNNIYSGTIQRGSYNDPNQKDIFYVKIPTSSKLTDPRLMYVGSSNGSTVYAILSEDIKFLTKGRYEIVNNINREINSSSDYTSADKLRTIKDFIQNEKYKARI